MSSPGAIYSIALDVLLLLADEILGQSPKRLRNFALTAPCVFNSLPPSVWVRCYERWFGALSFPPEQARFFCCQLVNYFERPVSFHFTTSCRLALTQKSFVETDIIAHLMPVQGHVSQLTVQRACLFAAPLFIRQAAMTQDRFFTHNKYLQGPAPVRYRQLYLKGTLPYRCAHLASCRVILSIFNCSIPQNQPSKAAKGRVFFEKTLPGYVKHLHALLAAVRRTASESVSSIPFCLPSMPQMNNVNNPVQWLQWNLQSTASSDRYPGGLAAIGASLDSPSTQLRSADHLRRVFEAGTGAEDVVMVLYHPALDPFHTIEDWAVHATNLTGGSAIGYAFAADLAVEEGWDRRTFGANSLDCIISIRFDTLRLINSEISHLIPPRTTNTFGPGLSAWLLQVGVDAGEAERVVALVERTRDFRRVGGAYKGGNPRLSGEAVPPQYTLPRSSQLLK
ncbi:hypothetical protein C8R43DRAFT_965601 [Mycena crocata]|nr:hypothetical protein C8R43DRAFT_965601 [Mycena crocata]